VRFKSSYSRYRVFLAVIKCRYFYNKNDIIYKTEICLCIAADIYTLEVAMTNFRVWFLTMSGVLAVSGRSDRILKKLSDKNIVVDFVSAYYAAEIDECVKSTFKHMRNSHYTECQHITI